MGNYLDLIHTNNNESKINLSFIIVKENVSHLVDTTNEVDYNFSKSSLLSI